jgi:transposase
MADPKPKKTTKDGLPFGRPTKYKPEYCQVALDMLSKGHSLYAVAAECDVSIDTIYEWQSVHQDFSDSIKRGQAKSAVWWEEKAQQFAETGVGNATAIIFGLKNRARKEWQDKQEVDMSVSRKEMVPEFDEL